MKRFIIVVLALLLVSSQAQQGGYFPLKVGMRWVYSSGEIQEYAREDTIFNTKVVVMQRTVKDQLAGEDYLAANGTGVNLVASRSGQQVTRYNPPIIIYPKAPLKVGMQWQSTADIGGGSKITIATQVIGTAGVKIKPGRFNAFIIRSSVYQADGSTATNDLYFVPSVGTVRYVYEDGNTIDLVSRK